MVAECARNPDGQPRTRHEQILFMRIVVDDAFDQLFQARTG